MFVYVTYMFLTFDQTQHADTVEAFYLRIISHSGDLLLTRVPFIQPMMTAFWQEKMLKLFVQERER